MTPTYQQQPTRVTSSSSTLIDLIFTSNTEKVTYNDVVEIGVSDHYMIVASWGNVKQKCDSHKYLITRNTSKLDVQEFQAELASVNWDEVYKEKDTEIAYEKVYE